MIAAWLLAAAIAAEPSPEPELDDALDCSISVNGRGEASIEPGTPLVVNAIALMPADRKTPATKLKVTLAGKEQTWPLAVAGTAKRDELEEREQETLWTLAPEATRALAPGDYAIAFVMEEKGEVAADCAPAILHVVAAGKADEDDALGAKLDYELLLGQKDEAAKTAAAWVQKRPESVEALIGAGDVALASGRPLDASKLYDRALAAALEGTAPGADPPLAILARARAAQRALADAK